MGWLPLPEAPEVPRPPVRNSQGTKGRPIALKANFFPVHVRRDNIELIHYDVDIKEIGAKEGRGKLSKPKQLEVFEAMKKQYPHLFGNYSLAFDSEKNAFSVSKIPQIRKNFSVDVTMKNKDTQHTNKYKVGMKIVGQALLRDLINALRAKPGTSVEFPADVFQMLQVMFNHTPSTKFDCVGRNTFYSIGGEFGPLTPLGGGKQGVVGFFSSLRPAQWKDGSLLLNVDVTNTAYYKEQNVIDFMTDMGFDPRNFNRPLDVGPRRRLYKELKGLQVEVTHSHKCRRYKIRDISPHGANRLTFPITDPNTKKTTQCTVEKYFMMTYNKRLRYPALNCLRVGPQNREVYLPIEVCRITEGQKANKRLSEAETAQLIRTTAKPPKQRLESICRTRHNADFNNDPLVKSLEFTIADHPITLDGRVLPAPSLTMNEDLKPRDGVWDSRNRMFYNAAELKTWAVMNYDPKFINKDILWKFLISIRNMGKDRGMTIHEPIIKVSYDPDPEREFLEIQGQLPEVQLILVVLPKFGNIYGRVKKTGDRDIKVLTQCVKATNVRTCAPPTVGNLLLKINAKMGGTNNILSNTTQPVVFTKPVMIMGADVNHPQAGDKSTPSLAAVVASMDRYASKYAVEVRHQSHRTEIIQEIRQMTKNLLLAFYQVTKRKPDRIIMYRDGVSESQFLQVLSYELKEMRKACTELPGHYEPAITFIVVQKRHHTRLFCQEKDGVGKSKNIPPGTTVDTAITHPTERDFYLCSHQGIQGTSKPTHYHCLWDDSDLTMDQMENLTYAMCHLYSRCTRSVSIPAPAYYAHLAAFRAKVHIQDLCHSESASVASGSADAGPSDAVMAQACQIGRGDGIFSKLYYV